MTIMKATRTRRLKHHPGVAGVDEAGRGPLAGPVVAAAAILPRGFDVEGLDDSKKLTPDQREALAVRIRESAVYCVALATVEEIDRLNIFWATMLAMERAVAGLGEAPSRILVDGNRVPNGFSGEAVVKGDGKFACIAAASILAKTERDRMMRECAERFPDYGFDAHFGYATPEHLRALEEFGPCDLHRKSFAPCMPDLQMALEL